jgi:hypothetical protein
MRDRIIGLLFLVAVTSVAFTFWAPNFQQPTATATRLTIKEMCQGPNRPDWCTEYYQDLAHGRRVRAQQAATFGKKKLEGKRFEGCTTDADCRAKFGGDINQPY